MGNPLSELGSDNHRVRATVASRDKDPYNDVSLTSLIAGVSGTGNRPEVKWVITTHNLHLTDEQQPTKPSDMPSKRILCSFGVDVDAVAGW